MRKLYLAAQLVAAQNAPYYTETKEGAKKIKRFMETAHTYVWYVRLLPFFPTGTIADYRKNSGKYVAFPWLPVRKGRRWLWDLERYNERYFSSLDSLIWVLNRAGFSIIFDLIDYCELFMPIYRNKSPLWRNIQGWKFGDKQITERIKDFAGRIIKMLQYHQPAEFKVEIGNEIYGGEKGAEFVKEMVDFLEKIGVKKNQILIPTGIEGGDYCHNLASAAHQRADGKIPRQYKALIPSVHLGTFTGAKADKIVNSGAWRWVMKEFNSIFLSTDGVGTVPLFSRDVEIQTNALNRMIEEVKKYKKETAILEIQSGLYWWAEKDEFGYERPHYRLKFLPKNYFEKIVSNLKADIERRAGDLAGAEAVLEGIVRLHQPRRWWWFFRDVFKRLIK